MSGKNSRTRLNAAVALKETPAFLLMFPIPLKLSGPQMLEIALAPTTPVTPEMEKVVWPFGFRAVTVLRTAYPVRAKRPCLWEAKYRLSS
jgi:hypothetical protein